MTLTEFLLARIAEDEEWARFAKRGNPPITSARILAECEAKRALIADLNSERHEVVDGDCWYTCSAATEERDGGETCDDSRLHGECDCGRDARVTRRLGILAAVYADHADYATARYPRP